MTHFSTRCPVHTGVDDTLQYTVLWLPSRYPALYGYAVLLAFTVPVLALYAVYLRACRAGSPPRRGRPLSNPSKHFV